MPPEHKELWVREDLKYKKALGLSVSLDLSLLPQGCLDDCAAAAQASQ